MKLSLLLVMFFSVVIIVLLVVNFIPDSTNRDVFQKESSAIKSKRTVEGNAELEFVEYDEKGREILKRTSYLSELGWYTTRNYKSEALFYQDNMLKLKYELSESFLGSSFNITEYSWDGLFWTYVWMKSYHMKTAERFSEYKDQGSFSSFCSRDNLVKFIEKVIPDSVSYKLVANQDLPFISADYQNYRKVIVDTVGQKTIVEWKERVSDGRIMNNRKKKYDQLGRLIEESNQTFNEPQVDTVDYSLSMVRPIHTGGDPKMQKTFEYDNNGNLIRELIEEYNKQIDQGCGISRCEPYVRTEIGHEYKNGKLSSSHTSHKWAKSEMSNSSQSYFYDDTLLVKEILFENRVYSGRIVPSDTTITTYEYEYYLN